MDPERLGGVLDQCDPCCSQGGDDPVVIGALPVEVDNERRGVLAIGESLGQEIGVHVPTGCLGVDEHRLGADVAHRVGAGGEGEIGDQHPVSRPDTRLDQSEVERRGAARERNPVAPPGEHRQFPLEAVHLGTERRNPPAVERGEQPVLLGGTDVGWER